MNTGRRGGEGRCRVGRGRRLWGCFLVVVGAESGNEQPAVVVAVVAKGSKASEGHRSVKCGGLWRGSCRYANTKSDPWRLDSSFPRFLIGVGGRNGKNTWWTRFCVYRDVRRDDLGAGQGR